MIRALFFLCVGALLMQFYLESGHTVPWNFTHLRTGVVQIAGRARRAFVVGTRFDKSSAREKPKPATAQNMGPRLPRQSAPERGPLASSGQNLARVPGNTAGNEEPIATQSAAGARAAASSKVASASPQRSTVAKPSKLEVIDAIRELAEQNDVSPPFAIALAAVESDFDPNARSRNSPTGLGLFQLDRSTRQALGVDEQRYLNDYRMQARLGVMRLADLLRRFKGSYTDALLAHHVGTARLQSGSLSRKDFEFVDRVLEEMTEPGGRASDGGS